MNYNLGTLKGGRLELYQNKIVIFQKRANFQGNVELDEHIITVCLS